MALFFEKQNNFAFYSAVETLSKKVNFDVSGSSKSLVVVDSKSYPAQNIGLNDVVVLSAEELRGTPFQSTGFGGFIIGKTDNGTETSFTFKDFYSYIASLQMATKPNNESAQLISVERQLEIQMNALLNHLPSFLHMNITNRKTSGLALLRESDQNPVMGDYLNNINRVHDIALRVVVSLTAENGLLVNITNPSRTSVTLSLRDSFIKDTSIDYGADESPTTLICYPKAENTLHTETYSYYLQADGTISTDSANEQRPARLEVFYYDDWQFEDGDIPPLAKAKEVFAETEEEQQIIANIDKNNYIPLESFEPFKKGIVYPYKGNDPIETTLTSVSFVSKDSVSVTFGYYRSSLTGKIKRLLSK